MPGRKWSEEETEKLIEMYSSHSSSTIANLLHRSRNAVIWKANTLGLKGKRGKEWSKEDTQKLIESYPTHANREIATALQRTINSVILKARELNLKKNHDFLIKVAEKNRELLALYRGKIWTKEEKEQFKKLYPLKDNEELAGIFKVSIGAIESQARRLGIHKGEQARRYRQGVEGEKVAEEFFRLNGWQIIEKGKSRGRGLGGVCFDFIVKTEKGEMCAIDVKYGSGSLKAKTVRNLMKLPYPPAILFITLDKEVFFMPITRLTSG